MKNPAVANVVTFSGFDLLSRALRRPIPASPSSRSRTGRSARIPRRTRATWRRRFAALNANFQRRHRHRLQPAADPGHQHHRRLRVLPAGSLGRLARRPVGGGQQGGAGRQPAPRAARRVHHLHHRRAAVSHRRRSRQGRALGIPINTIFETMQSSFGSLYVNDFSLFGRTYRVSLSSEADFREQPDDLRHVFVRSDNGAMVPLNELVTLSRACWGPTRSIASTSSRRPRSWAARRRASRPARRSPPCSRSSPRRCGSDFTIGWTGSAYQELATAGTGSLGFVFGLVMVFLILAAQYERWSLPLAVLTAVPFAVLGALARDLAARPRQRRLFPDRPGDADRARRQERHPDRRVRLAAPPRRASASTTPRWKRRGCASGRSS